MKSYADVDALSSDIEKAMSADKLAQAHLLISPFEKSLKNMEHAVCAQFLCDAKRSGCGACPSCRFFQKGVHPDCLTPGWDGTEQTRIKVSDIRELHEKIYTPPQIAKRRVLLLHRVDHLNISAGNALLKILEEPPSYVYFILSAQQLNTVLPTIISRCQQWRFDPLMTADTDFAIADYLNEAQAEIFSDKQACIENLIGILHSKIHPCDVAAQWSQYPLSAVLLFLYVVNSVAIRALLTGSAKISGESEGVFELGKLGTSHLYQQIDTITANIKQEERGIAINKTLLLEQLLMAYQEKSL